MSALTEFSILASRIWLLVLRQDAKFTRLSVKRLYLRNLLSRAPVVSSAGPIVSVTSYGARIQTVYLALEAIAAGTVLPSRLILWLDDVQMFKSPPLSLQRLAKRGLEILPTEDFGPHKKYYPYLLSTNQLDVPLVTADDDVLYSRWWLAGLIKAHHESRDAVSCYRAHVIKVVRGAIQPYRTWSRCESTEASFRHFPTGSGGCIYPALFLDKLKCAGAEFQRICPRADDIWLHANALRAGFKIKQIRQLPCNFPFLPGTQDGGLSRVNVGLGHNDEQIRVTYTSEDLALLATCSG
jgi:hypothetical protein